MSGMNLNKFRKKKKEMNEKHPASIKQVQEEQKILYKELKNWKKFWSQNKPVRNEDPSSALKILEKTTGKIKINLIKDTFLKNCTSSII